jgi:type II secretory pathway predicted ATPase ExeA
MPTPNSGTPFRRLLGQSERVFPAHPHVARYFPAAATENARRRLMRSIERGDGPGLIIGAPGTGKSLLLQVLAAQYQERFDVLLLACARICTRRALLQTLLFELGLPYRERDEGQLRLRLLDHLLSSEDCPTGLLLLVDEAQSLSVALLEELRVMTNLVRGGAPRVRLVLAGLPALEESFASPELESLSQRLTARCYLSPFNRVETSQFVRAQMAASEAKGDELFASEALDAVFEATDGVPRLVNQLCDRTLAVADAENCSRIDRQVVQTAWSDLQQLPSPWEVSTAVAAAAPARESVVEFGGLNVDAFDDPEPTELDPSDELVEVQEVPARTVRTKAVGVDPLADPFGETFDEEEIVLDNFSGWGDMFHRGTPRVENGRDREFAALVQAALEKCAAQSHRPSSSTPPGVVHLLNDPEDKQTVPAASKSDSEISIELEASHLDDDEYEIEDNWPPKQTDGNSSPDHACPPLRLAVMNDPVPLKPIPLVLPKSLTGRIESKAYAPVVPKEVDPDEDWTKNPPPRIATQKWTAHTSENGQPPILIIDEEAVVIAPTSAKPPVRREEYRRLFTRLRHGT